MEHEELVMTTLEELEQARRRAADQAFATSDALDGIDDAEGWDHEDASREWRRIVYYPGEGIGASVRRVFVVRFAMNEASVEETYVSGA